MSKILVTGAAGFIGAAVAKKLADQNHEVYTIDNLSTGKREKIPDKVKYVIGNVYDKEALAEFENIAFDAMIHIAGQSSGEISFEDPEYDLNTNAMSTLMLLKMALKQKCKNFIYASSMSVYGDAENSLVTEQTAPVPKSFYAVGKLASENYMRIYSSYGIRCTALRFFNVYGVGQNMDNMKQGMASIYLSQALRNGHILVKGAKDRFRDFVYIDDVVSAVLLAMKRQGKEYEVYNVSNMRPVTVEHVIDVIKEKLGGDITVEYGTGTPGDQHGIYGDNSKIRHDLGWIAKTDFETGMEKMIEWARGQK